MIHKYSNNTYFDDHFYIYITVILFGRECDCVHYITLSICGSSFLSWIWGSLFCLPSFWHACVWCKDSAWNTWIYCAWEDRFCSPSHPSPSRPAQVVRAIERDRENCVEISHYFVCKMRTVPTVHKYVKYNIHTELLKSSNILIRFLC